MLSAGTSETNMNLRSLLFLAACLLLIHHSNAIACGARANIPVHPPSLWNRLVTWFLRLFGMKSPNAEESIVKYYEAFINLQNDVVWPAPRSTAQDITDTFGPREKFADGGRYDWHRGIDITGSTGEPILASYNGIVAKIETDPAFSGGLTVVLEHTFKDPEVQFHDKIVDRWYSHYNHLHEIMVSEGESVDGGAQIGTLGDTGITEFPHLHHEIRVGSRCSYEFAVENGGECNTYGFDPHVHPMLAYPSAVISCSDINLKLIQSVTGSQDDIIQVETQDTAADVNQYKVQLVRPGFWFLTSETVVKEWELDLDLRKGFDPTSVETLDTQDKSLPYLEPRYFYNVNAEVWTTDFVIPSAWAGPKSTSNRFVVTARNTWHDTEEIIRFGWD